MDGFGKQLENVSRLYQVQIPVGDWENVDDGGLKKTLPVMGIKESDKPIVGLVLSSKDMDVIVNERIAFSNITIIDVFDDYIEIFCRLEAPTIPITIGIICT